MVRKMSKIEKFIKEKFVCDSDNDGYEVIIVYKNGDYNMQHIFSFDEIPRVVYAGKEIVFFEVVDMKTKNIYWMEEEVGCEGIMDIFTNLVNEQYSKNYTMNFWKLPSIKGDEVFWMNERE
jgi:hypothetical protein